MSVIRTFARPLQAAIFLYGGADALIKPARLVPMAEPVLGPLADRIALVPSTPETAVRLNGGVQVAAGALLATGRAPRLAALVLAATLVPVTWAGHRFWEGEDEQERAQQRIHFLKNLSMFGGLLLGATARGTAGSPARHEGLNPFCGTRHDDEA